MKNDLREAEILFLALADKTRLRILNLLREDEVCVCYFTEALGESQPKISRHLAYLRKAGVVSARRAGKWINYRIEMPENDFVAELLELTLRRLKMQAEMRADYEKLERLCRMVEVSDILARAPLPHTFAQPHMEGNADRKELETFLL